MNFFSLSGCHNQPASPGQAPADAVSFKNGLVVIDLDKLEQGEPIPFDSLFTGYEYIVNEQKDTFRISGWEHLQFDGDKHFVGANIPASYINLYDKTGNFIRRIGEQGRKINQGQFNEIFNFCIDPANKMVYALAHKQGKVFKYNYTGQFCGTVDILTTAIDRSTSDGRLRESAISDFIALTPSGDLLVHYAYWNGNLPYNFCLIDKSNTVVSTQKTMNRFNGKTRYGIEANSYTYDGCLHVSDISDTIYAIRDRAFVPKYVLAQKYPLSKIADSLGCNVDLFQLDLPVYKINSMQETDRYLFFSYIELNRKYSGVMKDMVYAYYDKRTKKAFKICTAEKMKKWTKDSISVAVLTRLKHSDFIQISSNKQGIIKLYLK